MRIKLIKPKTFFDDILTKKKINLKKFSKIIEKSYSALKKYRRGELTIPEETFRKLLNYSIDKNAYTWKEVADNWGQIKGGKIFSNKKELKRRLKYARTFRKIKKVEIKFTEFFCEFYGAMLGDGCITNFKDSRGFYKNIIIISGNKKLDTQYLFYLKKEIENEYGLKSSIYSYEKENVSILKLQNKSLIRELEKVGFPKGKKYDRIKVPQKIKNLSWNYKKKIIRGLFDTDGSIYAKKREDYKYPVINIRSKNIKFLGQLHRLLKEQNYPSYLSKGDISVRGIKNINKWFKDIGSSNQRNLLKYDYFLKNKRLPPKIIDGLVV